MKVNYRTHPILYNLDNGKLNPLKYDLSDKGFIENESLDIVNKWETSVDIFRSKINIISLPFYNASLKAFNKLYPIVNDIINNKKSSLYVKGTFILNHWVLMVDFNLGESDHSLFYLFHKNGTFLAFADQTVNSGIMWTSNTLGLNTDEDKMEWLKSQYLWVINIYMFKSFAEVETKILEPHSNTKDINCKYINETNLPVTYLDSKWFTTLIKSDAFNVRGHFRLQPKKKDGKWTHELIWISEFMKTGYTAPARKLS